MTLLTIIPDLIFAVLNVILWLIPSLAFPSSFITSMEWLIDFASPAGYFIDLSTFVTCLLILLVMYNIGLVFTVFGWIINFIPFLKKRE